MKTNIVRQEISNEVKLLIDEADVLINNVIINTNYEVINLFWNIAKMITDYKNQSKSNYVNYVIKRFNEELYLKYGNEFNSHNIYHALKFYEVILNFQKKKLES